MERGRLTSEVRLENTKKADAFVVAEWNPEGVYMHAREHNFFFFFFFFFKSNLYTAIAWRQDAVSRVCKYMRRGR